MLMFFPSTQPWLRRPFAEMPGARLRRPRARRVTGVRSAELSPVVVPLPRGARRETEELGQLRAWWMETSRASTSRKRCTVLPRTTRDSSSECSRDTALVCPTQKVSGVHRRAQCTVNEQVCPAGARPLDRRVGRLVDKGTVETAAPFYRSSRGAWVVLFQSAYERQEIRRDRLISGSDMVDLGHVIVSE